MRSCRRRDGREGRARIFEGVRCLEHVEGEQTEEGQFWDAEVEETTQARERDAPATQRHHHSELAVRAKTTTATDVHNEGSGRRYVSTTRERTPNTLFLNRMAASLRCGLKTSVTRDASDGDDGFFVLAIEGGRRGRERRAWEERNKNNKPVGKPSRSGRASRQVY